MSSSIVIIHPECAKRPRLTKCDLFFLNMVLILTIHVLISVSYSVRVLNSFCHRFVIG